MPYSPRSASPAPGHTQPEARSGAAEQACETAPTKEERNLPLFLQQCERDATKRVGQRPSLFAMFEQLDPLRKGAQACVVWWVPSWNGWLVYAAELRPYQITPGEGADLVAFLKDLRNNYLCSGINARARYRARLLVQDPCAGC